MCKVNQFPTLINQDGMAVVGRTLHDLRGIRFAEGDGGNGGDGGDGAGDGDGDDADKGLGDKGQQAIDRMKAERNTARAEAKAYKDLGLSAADIKALVEERDKNEAPDEEKIEKRLRAAIESESKERSASKFRASNVREQAATLGFNSPKDALALLNAQELAAVDVDDDGEVDDAAVKKLLEKLSTDKPYLLKPTDTTADASAAGIGASGSGKQPDVRPGLDRMRSAYENTPKK